VAKNPLMDIPDIFITHDEEQVPGVAEDGLLPDEVIRQNIAEHEQRVREYLAKTEQSPRQAG
jgi:hypothetical protein